MNTTPTSEPAEAPTGEPKAANDPPSPEEITAIVLNFLRGYWNAPRHKAKWTESATAILTLLIAAAAFWSAWIFQGQLTQANQANELTEKQWKAQQRPWIGISQGGATLPSQLSVQVFKPAPRPGTSVEINVSMRLKNFGVSPAFKVYPQVMVMLSKSNDVSPPQFEMWSTCEMADHPAEFEGNVMFPGGEFVANFDESKSQQIELAKTQRIWVFGCISYWDAAGGLPHHTKFWIFSNLIPANSVAVPTTRQELRGGAYVEFFTLPIAGWNMLKTEAD